MWAIKIFIKLILSRLPIKNSIWRKLGIFRNGGMHKKDYSKKIFFGHLEDLKKIRDIKKPVIMEIGPGDGIATAIYSKIYDSPKVYLIDVEDFADKDILIYKEIIESLNFELFEKNIFNKIKTIEDLLKACNAYYLVEGLQSLEKIESNSVDYLFSHSVMEHIRFKELDKYIKEMYRVLKPNGLISHNINYKDHLDDSLNNLRFSFKIWESNLFSNSGFYTNRVPAIDMHSKFTKYGFKMVWEKFGQWPLLPLKRKYIHKDFKLYTDENLLNRTSAFVASK
tara:strand:- start:112 stop:954 length:843 start_codon:yes stop_codon:yes gene_type:complete